MTDVFQNLEFDVLAAYGALAKEVEPVVVLAPMPMPERVYIPGIIRDPKPGAIRAPGTRRIPQPYTFIKGKRVANRSQRFSQR